MIKTFLALLFLLTATPAWAQLALSDFVVPSGQETVLLAVIVAGGSGDDIYFHRGGQSDGTQPEGSLEITGSNGAIVDGFRSRSPFPNGRVTFNKSGGDGFSTMRAIGGILENATTWLQTDTSTESSTEWGNAGGGFIDIPPPPNPVSVLAATFTTGTRFILAITVPAATPTDNCNIYWGSQDLTAPSQLRFGATTPVRAYWGSTLVCGDQP